MDYISMIKEIRKIVAKFLKQHGGYPNGFGTYVNGTVRFNSISAFDWKTPSIGDMTLKEHQSEGFKLATEIAQYLKKIELLSLSLIIKQKYALNVSVNSL